MSYMTANKGGAASSGAETAETPILCDGCLGENPFINMTRQAYGKECKASLMIYIAGREQRLTWSRLFAFSDM